MFNSAGQIIINVGLDVSFNSTGVTMFDTELKFPIQLFRITSSNVPLDKQSPNVHYISYARLGHHKVYGVRESNKVQDSTALSRELVKLLKTFRRRIAERHGVGPEQVFFDCRIEGNVFGTFGMRGGSRVDNHSDMIMINSIVRCELLKMDNISMWSVAPSSVKSYFTGSGKAKKIDMINEFVRINPHIPLIDKMDDVVDSYALALHVEPWDRQTINWKEVVIKHRAA